MSEFSESYHLRGTDIDEGVALVRRSGLKGYVFPPANGWIPIVIADHSFAPDQRVVSQNTGTLLHFVSAEDHGWTFALFEGDKAVSAYDCGWDDDVRVDLSRYAKAPIAEMLGVEADRAIAAIEAVLHPADIDAAIDSQPAQTFAEAMRLPRFEWFAYDYVARDYHEQPSDYIGVVKVGDQ
ncbi:MAG: hypothetical protein IPL39_15635 [Opitutaceae bacterium]|nr:hypothetical protein [Opitutaceae bacterium]